LHVLIEGPTHLLDESVLIVSCGRLQRRKELDQLVQLYGDHHEHEGFRVSCELDLVSNKDIEMVERYAVLSVLKMKYTVLYT